MNAWWGAGDTQGLPVLQASHRICSRTLGAILGFSSAGRKGALSTWGSGFQPCWNLTFLGKVCSFPRAVWGSSRGVLAVQGTRHGGKGGTGGTGTSAAAEWLECPRNVPGMPPHCPGGQGAQPHMHSPHFLHKPCLVAEIRAGRGAARPAGLS